MRWLVFAVYVAMWTLGELGTIGGAIAGRWPVAVASLVIWGSAIALAIKYARPSTGARAP